MDAQIASRIARVPLCALDDVVRAAYAEALAGQMSEDEVAAIHQAVNDRRVAPTTQTPTVRMRPSIFPPRRQQPRPEASVVRQRRRRVAASGAVPSKLAANFTQGEIAVLSIIAMEVRGNDRCTLCNDEIAAKSGTSRSTVKNTLREAKRLGLIAVTLRPRRGAKNLPNVVEITDAGWLAWLLRDGPVDRGQNAGPHEYPHLSIDGRDCHPRQERARRVIKDRRYYEKILHA